MGDERGTGAPGSWALVAAALAATAHSQASRLAGTEVTGYVTSEPGPAGDWNG